MSKQGSAKRTNLRPVDGEAAPTTTDPKPKRPRKPRAGTASFSDELRAIAATHRTKLGSLVDAEAKLEAQLASVRAQREAAEGPLREVEAMLERYPALPLEQPAPLPEPGADAAGEAVSP